jgi:hypothetical protein
VRGARVSRWRRTASKPDVFADPFATRQRNDDCGLDVCLAHPAGAQTPSAAFVPTYTGTLKKIEETEAVQIGYRDKLAAVRIPRCEHGYSLDLCEVVVDEIAAEARIACIFAVVTQNQ